MTRKRDLFDELMEGFDALADRRAGKRTPAYACDEGEARTRDHSSRACKGPTGHESFAGAVCTIFAYECADARELGAGTGQAKCSSRVADSNGTAVPGHCAPTCGDLKSPQAFVLCSDARPPHESDGSPGRLPLDSRQ
jgi:hypothetical protein